ncbi:MAG: tryptophan--tRNA ligase, partial [Gammaproteobacteria bacterium]
GWGDMKSILFNYINDHIEPARERYEALLQAPEHIEEQLQEGAKKARAISIPFMQQLREAVGISRIRA